MKEQVILLPGNRVHKVPPHPDHEKKILKEKQPKTIEALAQDLGVGVEVVRGAIDHLKEQGHNIHQEGEVVINGTTAPEGEIYNHETLHTHNLHFGVVSDTHMGSKKERLHELNLMYDFFETEGVGIVYHVGDITEGWGVYRGQEFEVNKFGQDEQIDHVVANYPQRDGIDTYFITGNHDLRQTERGGVDPGIPIAQRRKDLQYIGQMTSKVVLPEGVEMELLHPAGGGAYALSYKAQKYINNLAPEDVPDMLLFGHYHTSFYMHYRNVHFMQVPAFKDAGLWEKRLGLNPTIGGWLVDGQISPDSGRIARLRPELVTYASKRK